MQELFNISTENELVKIGNLNGDDLFVNKSVTATQVSQIEQFVVDYGKSKTGMTELMINILPVLILNSEGNKYFAREKQKATLQKIGFTNLSKIFTAISQVSDFNAEDIVANSKFSEEQKKKVSEVIKGIR